jgi:hypothetical protein
MFSFLIRNAFDHNKKDNGFACLAKSYICNNSFYKFCFVDVSRWCEYVYFGYQLSKWKLNAHASYFWVV